MLIAGPSFGPRPRRFRHGTAADLAPSIEKNGLLPAPDGAVYCTSSWDMATVYACWSAALCVIDKPQTPARGVIYEVDLTGLRRGEEPDSLAPPLPWNSWVYHDGRVFYVNGTIPPERLTKVDEFEVSEMEDPGMRARVEIEADLVEVCWGGMTERARSLHRGSAPRPDTLFLRQIPEPGDGLLKAAVDAAPRAFSKWHGMNHWRGVCAAGAQIIKAGCRADAAVVYAFAVLHDAQRESEGPDPEHGERAAALADQFQGLHFHFDYNQMWKLRTALREHDHGQVSDDPTIGACWDADRLVLPRLGIKVDHAYLSTPQAKALDAAGLVIGQDDCNWEWIGFHFQYVAELARRLEAHEGPVWYGDHRDGAAQVAA